MAYSTWFTPRHHRPTYKPTAPTQPSTYGPKRNIELLDPVLTICKYLAIFPSNKDRATITNRCAYPVTVMVLIVITYIVHVAAVSLDGPAPHFLELVADGLLVIAVLGAILYTNIIHGHNYNQFHLQLKLFDKRFRTEKMEPDKSIVRLYLELTLTHIVYCIVMLQDPPQWKQFRGWYYSPQLFRRYLFYVIVITSFAVRHFALNIKYRFHMISELILKIKRDNTIGSNKADKKTPRQALLQKLNHTSKMPFLMQNHTDLTRITYLFNIIFSWYFAMMVTLMHASTIMPINGIHVFFNGLRYLPANIAHDKFVMFTIIWFTFPRLITTVVLNSCYFLESGAERVPRTCYLIIHHLVKGDFTDRTNDRIYLFELAIQSSTNKTLVWAADHFLLTHSTVITFFSGISFLVIGVMYLTQLPA